MSGKYNPKETIVDEEKIRQLNRVLGIVEVDFVHYLQETLIPDLKVSGSDSTAQDFERCLEIMSHLLEHMK